MFRFTDKKEDVVPKMLEGLALAHPGLAVDVTDRLVACVGTEKRVGVVVMGGAGHEPFGTGTVGPGLADAFVLGDVFSAPGPAAVLKALELADHGQGVLLIVLNHAGDMLTANIAEKEAARRGKRVSKIVVADDAALASRSEAAKRRGLAGAYLVLKAAAVLAKEGKSLEEAGQALEAFAREIATLGVRGLSDGSVEVGSGIHCEDSGKVMAAASVEKLCAVVIAKLVADLELKAGEQVFLMVSGMGAITAIELLVIYRACARALAAQQIEVMAGLSGEYVTVLAQPGFFVTLVRMEQVQKLPALVDALAKVVTGNC